MEIMRSQRKSAADEVPILSLYRSAPQVEVILDDFERFAIDRLLGNFEFQGFWCVLGLGSLLDFVLILRLLDGIFVDIGKIERKR